MATMPTNPNYANSVTSGTDTSISESVTGGGANYLNPSVAVVTTSGSHNVASRGDQALYDTVSGAYVAIQSTNIGTTAAPKNGQ